MTARKAERLMNLTICLLVARTFVPKDKIRVAVEGYHDLSDEAFNRMFDRDKEELRVIGIPLELGYTDKAFDDEPGYRIRRDRFELPEISLAADESAVLGLAARVWQHARLAADTTQAIRKLKAGGVDVDETPLAVLEPALATDEPAFEPVFEAVTAHLPITFPYRASGAAGPTERHLEPWGIVSWHGHWYVVGHDRDRDAARMFRVSRISGPVAPIGEPGSYSVPDDLDLRALASTLGPPHPHSTAVLRLREGAGGALRRRAVTSAAVDDGWTEVEVPYGSGSALAEELLPLAADVVVVGPDEVREAVVRRLRALVGTPTA